MKRKPYSITLAGVTYTTKKAAREAVQAWFASCQDGAILVGRDLRMALDILEAHPHYEWKCRGGVFGFYVGPNAEWPATRCLTMISGEHGHEALSYRVALGIAPAEPSFRSAAREAVAFTIRQFKREEFRAGRGVCAITGQRLLESETHVDHAPPWTFEEIIRDFLARQGEMPVIHNGSTDTFEHALDAERFLNFHNERARLRLTHWTVNTGTLRRRTP
jgi:hypothetical protein